MLTEKLVFNNGDSFVSGEDNSEEGRKWNNSQWNSEERRCEGQVHDSVPHRAAPRHPGPQQRVQRDHHGQEFRAFYAGLSLLR